jgi:hypothetical protein
MAPEVFEYSEQELTGGRQQVQGDKLAGDDGPAGWGEWSLLRRPRACAGGRVSGGGWGWELWGRRWVSWRNACNSKLRI